MLFANQIKYLFLKRKGEGISTDLYIMNICVCVCVCVYFSFLTLLGPHINCIFVHSVYILVRKCRLSIQRLLSLIDYIYPTVDTSLNLF